MRWVPIVSQLFGLEVERLVLRCACLVYKWKGSFCDAQGLVGVVIADFRLFGGLRINLLGVVSSC